MATSERALHLLEQTSAGYRPVQSTLEHLKRVLSAPDMVNLNVAVVSVAGAKRTGKSVLLNLILRALRWAAEGDSRSLTDPDWLHSKNNLNDGFSWSAGSAQNTTGVLIWSRPFVVKGRQGNDCPKTIVLLMDTQGSFDGSTDETDCSAVFAFSSMVASTQIFNVVHNINDNVLGYLDAFTVFGALSVKDFKLYQRLIIRVRDWDLDKQFGLDNGRQFIEKELGEGADPISKNVEMRRRIKNSFERIDCTMMPHPGLDVVEGGWTNLQDAKENYLTTLKELINVHLVEPKRMMEKAMKAGELVDYIESLLVLFEKDKTPKVAGMYETLKAHVKAKAITSAVQTYEKSFLPEAMQIGVAVADRLWREKVIAELEKGLLDKNEVPSKELNEKLDTIRDRAKADIDERNKREVDERRARFSINFKKACQSAPTSTVVYETYRRHRDVAFEGLKESLRGGPDADRFIKKLEKELAKELEHQESLAEERRKTKEMTETLAREREEAKRAEEKRKQEDEQRRVEEEKRRKEDADRVAKAEEAKKEAEERLRREKEERDRLQRENERLKREKLNDTLDTALKAVVIAGAAIKGVCDIAADSD